MKKNEDRRSVHGVPLAGAVLAALEHAAPKERTELQQRLLVYVAEIAIVLVQGLTVRQLRADLNQSAKIFLEAFPALSRHDLVLRKNLARGETYRCDLCEQRISNSD